jgi:hypothetical protein
MTDDEIRLLLTQIEGISGTRALWPGCKVISRARVEQKGGVLTEVDDWVERVGGTTDEVYPLRRSLPPHLGQQPLANPRVYVVPQPAVQRDGGN